MRLNKFLLGLFMAAALASQAKASSLVIDTSSDPKTFNDIVATETSSSAVTSFLFEGLTTSDPFTLKVIPNLAERWEVSPDGLQWVFHLRPNVKFFDGKPFTADDVVFTFNDLIYNDDIPSSSKDVFTIEGKRFKVEKIDDLTVRFTLPVKFAPFLRSMSQAILPKHCLQDAVAKKKFPFTWGINTPPKQIIGTGPFYLDQYAPGERLIFKRNPHYWKKDKDGHALPRLDKVVMLIVADPDTSLLKFIDGEIDIIDVRGRDYPLLKPMEVSKNFKIYNTGADFGSSFLVLNLNSRTNPKTSKYYVDPIKLAWFQNVNFRRAIAHAIDKGKIIDIVNSGFGYSQWGPMSPSSGFLYNANTAIYPFDLNQSKALLAKEGFKDNNGDGILEDPQGHTVEFTLSVPTSGTSDREQVSGIIRSDLERIGMKVNVKLLEFNSLVSKVMSTYDWEAVMLSLTGGIEPHFGQNVWVSTGQLHLWNPKQEKPETLWEKRIDEIFNLGVQELDENKRKVLYDEFQLIASEQLPVIYTVLGANMFAVRQRFGNLRPSPNGGILHNIEEIYALDQP